MLEVEAPDELSVFLNVPFDKAYEENFAALLTGLISLGRKPRTALDIPERGEGRLERIFVHLEQCRASVHDLSRVGDPSRFNMPFEAGLAFALRRYQNQHSYHVVILEEKRFRLQKTLSDLSGRDPYIHKGEAQKILVTILETFGVPGDEPPLEILTENRKLLSKMANGYRKRYRAKTIFTPLISKLLAEAAVRMALESKLLAP